MKDEAVMFGVIGLFGLLGLIYLVKNFNGAAIGSNAAGLVTGFVGGVGSSVATVANNPDVNPLYNVGSSIGESIFNLFNTVPNLNSPPTP